MEPILTLNGFANISLLTVRNFAGDYVIFRAEGVGGKYTEYDVSESANWTDEDIDPLKAYKYKVAFIEDGQIGRVSDSRIRARRTVVADPPVVTGSFQMEEVFIGPPVVEGSFQMEEV